MMTLMAGFKTILCEKKEPILYITLNRPQVVNAINPRMAMELEEACLKANQEGDIRAVIITGAGDSFCSGVDLKEFADNILKEASLTELKEFVLRYNVASIVAGINCPVIAAINGEALGMGLALALGCDLRLASEGASFGVPDTAHGYLLPSGITQWLPRIVGRGKALEMLLTAEPMGAQQVYQIGLIHRVVPSSELIPEVERLARKMVSGAPLSLKYAKEAVHKGLDLTLEQGLGLECDLYMILQTTQDRVEGITAFLQKRTPQFKGK